jgi:crotonobetainyl-CoA:carnitine CoA-transferase CaiB-like acyl-CoA transferase
MEDPLLPPFPALLAGLRVLDATRVLAGPFCGQLLGDLGAEVIKVERPGSGDETRSWAPPFHPAGPAAYYLSCNRNKRGVALDLARPEGRDLFHGLVRHSDVVLENFRADSAEKLGLGADQLLAVNPRVVVCSISGFGRSGPLRDLPGYDFAVQAMSGLMSITGPVEGPPCKVGVAVTDVLTGLYAASAVLACLIARGRSGHGYAIDLALLDCAVAGQVNVVQAFLSRLQAGASPAEAAPARQGNAHLQIVPYQLFATADGWLVLAVGNDGQWRAFSRVALPELADDPHFATNPDRVRRRDELVPLVEKALRSRTTAEWGRLLEEAGVPHAPLWTYAELFSHPQAQARGLAVRVRDAAGRPIDLVASPFRVGAAGGPPAAPPASAPPGLGEHTDLVLRELCGLGEEGLARLRRDGVIG